MRFVQWWRWAVPRVVQALKEAEFKEVLCEVFMWWHGLRMAKVTVEVVGEAITSAEAVWNIGVGDIFVGPKSMVVDEGEEHFDKIREGQDRVVVDGHFGCYLFCLNLHEKGK